MSRSRSRRCSTSAESREAGPPTAGPVCQKLPAKFHPRGRQLLRCKAFHINYFGNYERVGGQLAGGAGAETHPAARRPLAGRASQGEMRPPRTRRDRQSFLVSRRVHVGLPLPARRLACRTCLPNRGKAWYKKADGSGSPSQRATGRGKGRFTFHSRGYLGFVRKRPKTAEFSCSPLRFLACPSCNRTRHLKE
jgi:hypothetical protein